MTPPANHGSYGGKYSLLVTAFKYAKFIGFSPPKTGCHRSGFAARMNRKMPKPARKTASVTHNRRRSRRIQARKAERCDQVTATDAPNTPSQISNSTGCSNGASLKLAISQPT